MYLSARGISLASNVLFFTAKRASAAVKPLLNLLGGGVSVINAPRFHIGNNGLKSMASLISALAYLMSAVESDDNYANKLMLLSSMLGAMEFFTTEIDIHSLEKVFARYISPGTNLLNAIFIAFDIFGEDKFKGQFWSFLECANLNATFVTELLEQYIRQRENQNRL